MTVLVTGSSGWLGRHVMQMLRNAGRGALGLDVVPSPWTDVVASVADRPAIEDVFRAHDISAVIHSGALHKPDIARYPQQAFIDVNVTGALNLLEVASARPERPFIFTSTTSLMISQAIRDEQGPEAIWLDETAGPLAQQED